MPKYETSFSPETVINSFYLQNIVALRSSLNLSDTEIEDLFNPKKEELEIVLARYAKALKKYAFDILRGDFKIFSQLEQIVKTRAKLKVQIKRLGVRSCQTVEKLHSES